MNDKGSAYYYNEPVMSEIEDFYSYKDEAPIDDETIKSSVLSCLIWYAHVPIEDITIEVNLGYVELRGSVPWMYQKFVIADMVKNLRGVKGIINNVLVICKLSYPYLKN